MQNEKFLSTMPKLICEVCLPDIDYYYDDSFEIVSKNQSLLFMASGHRQGSKLLAPGRVIVVRDGASSSHCL